MKNEELGKMLEGFRKNAGYSVDQLSNLLSISSEEIHNWESGKSEPSLTQSLLLFGLYGIQIEDGLYNLTVTNELPQNVQDEYHKASWTNRISNRYM